MDRTAWVAIILCVIGLVLWEWWTISHAPPRPATIAAPPPPVSPTPSNLASATAAPLLTEYELTREGDAVQLKQTTADNVTIRKKFFFPKAETKDNYIVELDVDLTNGGTKPYANPGYFLGLGSAAPIHANDYPSYQRLAWCIDGKGKGIDVGWFTGSNGFLGLGQRMARPFYQENR